MTWAPNYATKAQLKAYLRIADADTQDDTQLDFALVAASRAIDAECNRQFGVTTAQPRYYAWGGEYLQGRPALLLDDVQAVTSLAVLVDQDGDSTFETTLTNETDFDFYPWNAAAESKPWTHLVLRPGAATGLPCRARSVKVTALFGWTAVPDTIVQAALLQASRFFARRNAPFGIAGSPELGSEIRLLAKVDADVAVVLAPYRRVWAAV